MNPIFPLELPKYLQQVVGKLLRYLEFRQAAIIEELDHVAATKAHSNKFSNASFPKKKKLPNIM